MDRKDAEPGSTHRPAKKPYRAPRLVEIGGLATLTRMDGIGHNGSGLISGSPP